MVKSQIQEIRRALRSMMSGPVSSSMREKGLAYKLNFGVDAVRLRQLADQLPHTHELAAVLWKEDVRELRLLAAMVQPVESFPPELADLWVEQMRFPEEAEYTVMNLFARLPYASEKAFAWMAREEFMFRLCGFLLMARLLIQGATPAPRDADELLDQAEAALHDSDTAVRLAAAKCLIKFEDTCPQYAERVEALLES